MAANPDQMQRVDAPETVMILRFGLITPVLVFLLSLLLLSAVRPVQSEREIARGFDDFLLQIEPDRNLFWPSWRTSDRDCALLLHNVRREPPLRFLLGPFGLNDEAEIAEACEVLRDTVKRDLSVSYERTSLETNPILLRAFAQVMFAGRGDPLVYLMPALIILFGVLASRRVSTIAAVRVEQVFLAVSTIAILMVLGSSLSSMAGGAVLSLTLLLLASSHLSRERRYLIVAAAAACLSLLGFKTGLTVTSASLIFAYLTIQSPRVEINRLALGTTFVVSALVTRLLIAAGISYAQGSGFGSFIDVATTSLTDVNVISTYPDRSFSHAYRFFGGDGYGIVALVSAFFVFALAFAYRYALAMRGSLLSRRVAGGARVAAMPCLVWMACNPITFMSEPYNYGGPVACVLIAGLTCIVLCIRLSFRGRPETDRLLFEDAGARA